MAPADVAVEPRDHRRVCCPQGQVRLFLGKPALMLRHLVRGSGNPEMRGYVSKVQKERLLPLFPHEPNGPVSDQVVDVAGYRNLLATFP